MAKRKNTNASRKSKNDAKPALVILGLLAAGIVLFFIFSKPKETPVEKPAVQGNEAVDRYLPSENVRPVEPELVPQPYEPPPVEKIPGSGGRIAIILDDWGQSMANCKYLKEISEPLAVSILPGLRHTKDVAACAGQYHKLTMLHLPLEALHNYDFYPPNYIIKTTMPPDLVNKIVEGDLAQLPSIEGVNNHMGSKATESRYLMKLVFKKVRARHLFFIDSMTARNTVCAALAQEMGLSFGKRDVFLDNIMTREAIIKQFVDLARKARQRGYAVAIGHDRRLTMQVLKDEIPWLEKQGFQIVSIKQLIIHR